MRPLALAVLLLLAGLFPALAYEPEEAARLDVLFERLSRAADREAARAIDAQIWTIWTRPADPVLARRMADVIGAQNRRDPRAARRLLDAIVADFPDYAEGWNQRATVAFLLGDYEASLADIDEVLKREPRHFGALSGQAMIYNLQGRRAQAVEVMRKALRIHPFLVEKGSYPELDTDTIRA